MPNNRRGKEKRPTDAPEEDFEAFVRVSLTDLSNGQTIIMQDIWYLRVKVQQNEAALDKISTLNFTQKTDIAMSAISAFQSQFLRETKRFVFL